MFHFIQSLKKFNLPLFSTLDVCFDLGTANTIIAIKDKGKVLTEPTYIGYNTLTKQYIFFGKEAKTILGKTPDFLKVIRPIVNGVISDFDAEVSLVRSFIEKSVFVYLRKFSIIKPQLRAIAAVPHIATEIEQKAVEEMLSKIGFSNVVLVEKPIAVAAGSDINIFSHHPHLIADMGAGLIELSIVSGGGIVVEKTLKTAGDSLNQAFAHYSYLKNGIILGEATCEEIKISLLNFSSDDKTMTVRGKSLENGLPKSVRIRSSDVKEALMNNFILIIDGIKELIEISPPEIVDEIFKRGIMVTGGLANIKGLDRFLAEELKIDVHIGHLPQDHLINGLLKIGKNPELIQNLAIPKI